MDIYFNDTKEEYLYYEELVSLYPEKIYVTNNITLKNTSTYKYLGYSKDTFCVKYNVQQKHDIICADNFDDSDEKYKSHKKKNNLNKIKMMTLSSLFVVSAVLANNYLSDK